MSSPAQPSRRRFLKTGCLTAAAVGVTLCGGGAFIATRRPQVDLPTSTLGQPAADNRLLIAYASKAGATAEVAVKMGQLLAGRGRAVDVRPVASVTDLSPYRAVILGSAIRTGKVLAEVQTFVEKNQAVLGQVPFSVFITCMTLATDTEENRQKVSAYLDPIRAVVKPASEGLFAGALNPQKLTLLEGLMMSAMQSPTGDFRKWDLINAWAEKLS